MGKTVTLKLTKKQTEIYKACLGKCRICFYDGSCTLQNKLNKKQTNS